MDPSSKALLRRADDDADHACALVNAAGAERQASEYTGKAKAGGCVLTSTPDGFDPMDAGEKLLDAIERCTVWKPGRYSAEFTIVDLGEARQVVLSIGGKP